MIKTKTKIILIMSLTLLFLITSIGQAKAATVYRVDYNVIAKSLHHYLWEPTVDLAVFTGQNLAGISQYLPSLIDISRDTGNFAALAISNFDHTGQVFNAAGDALAIIPNNLPNFKKISIGYGNLLIDSNKRINDVVVFFQKTFSNLTDTPKKQNYPYTQSLIANARRNLENNFNRLVGATIAEANQIK
jgi:hypothetical protein